MAHYGVHWKFDGVGAAFVRKGQKNGQYAVLFERDSAELAAIEAINWAKPTVEHLVDRPNEFSLPEGYGFEVMDISYDHNIRAYTVELKTAAQYLGDVTGYQEEIEGLNATVAEKDTTIATLEADLEEADELVISLYEAQLALEEELAAADEMIISLYEASLVQAGEAEAET